MYRSTGWWWWDSACWNHEMFSQIDANCAWSEGWADFVSLVVNEDSCYDFGVASCTEGSFDLEEQMIGDGYPSGDTTGARVAGALYDLFDTTNDPPFDSASFGLDPISDIVFQGANEPDFYAFWVGWKSSGQNKHHAVRAIWQNTIFYDSYPYYSMPLPDREMAPDSAIYFDLWSYTADEESIDAELSYTIVYARPSNCGVSVQNNHWIYIVPQSGWIGNCDVAVRVSDSLRAASDIFQVRVGRTIDLPIIMK
jgi:hypothetical protein